MKVKMIQLILILILLSSFVSCSKAVIEGQIVDDLGVAVEGTQIKIVNTAITTTTDSNGNFSLDFIPGKFEIVASKEGYISNSVTFEIAQKVKFVADKIIIVKIPSIIMESPKNQTEDIMGKWFTIKGKTDRNASVTINGRKIKQDENDYFEKKYSLRHGENRFTIQARPLKHKEANSVEIVINRKKYPAEIEYSKAYKHATIHSGRVDDFAIDKNERYLVTVYGHGKIHVYDLKKQKLLRTLPKPKKSLGYYQAVSFSPDNKCLMIGLYYLHYLEVYDVKNWTLMKSRYIRGGMRLATNDKNNMILSGCNGIYLLDPKTFSVKGCFTRSGGSDALAISPNGMLIATNATSRYDTGEVIVFNSSKPYTGNIERYRDIDRHVKKLSRKTKVSQLKKSKITRLLFATDSHLISGTSRGEVIVSTVNKDMTLSFKNSFKIGEEVKSIALARQKNLLIVGTKKGIYFTAYPSLKLKMYLSIPTGKILLSDNEKSFFYKSGIKRNSVKRGTLNINWDLIQEYYRLKKDKVI